VTGFGYDVFDGCESCLDPLLIGVELGLGLGLGLFRAANLLWLLAESGTGTRETVRLIIVQGHSHWCGVKYGIPKEPVRTHQLLHKS